MTPPANSLSPPSGSSTYSIEGASIAPCSSIPLSDRGFRFGMHFFETVAIRNSRWLYYQEHLQILFASARSASFSAPPDTEKTLLSLPSLFPLHEGIARIFWTAGDGSPFSPPSLGRIFFSLSEEPLPASPPSPKLRTHPTPIAPPLPGKKTGNYWTNTLACQDSQKNGFDDALFFNSGGFLVGSCFGNVFVKIGETWTTPPASDGAREGVTRRWLLERSFARVASIPTPALANSSALLITNSRTGPCLAASLDDRLFPPPENAAFLDTLWREYSF